MRRLLGFNLIILTVFFGMAVWVQPAQAVNWSKCEVRQGETTIDSTKSTQTLSLSGFIKDRAQTFVLSYSSGDSGVQAANNHMVNSEITAANEVQFNRSGTSGTAHVSYSVVQCFDHEFTVLSGSIPLNSSAVSGTATISSVAAERSFVIASTSTADAAANEAAASVKAALNGDAQVVVQRAATSSAAVQVKYQVVTFAPETNATVQTNEVTLGSGVAEASSTLTTAVDRSRSWVYCTYDATNNGLMQTAIGCELDSTTNNVVKVHRYSAAAYTNRIRYYVMTWPADTVTVQHDSSSQPFDVNAADGTTPVNDDITIGAVSGLDKAFSYVTTMTKGTGTLFPRNRWINYLYDRTTLRTTFWRADPADYDASYKYWQVISFPSPYQATGWGWIGSSVDDDTGTTLISFDCDNLTSYYGTGCGDGTNGTRYDYGVSLEHGGCGSTCAVNGTAWVGVYDNADSQVEPLGMITFDPDVSNGSSLPIALGDDVTTIGEDERSAAMWNEETNELYGWARFTALEDYEENNADVASIHDNWGWIKLRGQVNSATEYGVDYDPVAGTFAEGSWAWNDNGTAANGTTELDGSGFGWVRFDLGTSGTVSEAWLKTSQGDVYSQGGINVTTDPATYGDFGSTYLILADGSVSNFTSEHGSVSTSTDLGTVPTDIGSNIYRGAIGTIHVNELIDHPVQPLYVYDGDCDDDWLRDFTNPLSGAVYYCTGDMTINNNLTFYNASGAGLGTGTIVVGGNLYINDNIGYYNNTIDQNINNLASVAFIVQGRVEIDSGVTNLVGAYIVLGDANPSVSGVYDFATGGSSTGGYNAPLELAGLVMARSFHFQRNSKGIATDPQPSEHIYYDGRIFASTPPGLEDLAAILPSFN